MFSNVVTDILKHEIIVTNVTRANETRRMAEKMMTLAKRGDLHEKRQVVAYVRDEAVAEK